MAIAICTQASASSFTPSVAGSPKNMTIASPTYLDTLRRYAAAAGFGAVEILPIEHDLFRLYRLRP